MPNLVVDSETGAPLPRTQLLLAATDELEQAVITTGTGAFAFDVPQGKYVLLASSATSSPAMGRPLRAIRPRPGHDGSRSSRVRAGNNRDQKLFPSRLPVKWQ